MEVHHHPHTSRKKWTHYFWEFLMLFLAVFCGFLAEYQLEHRIEKERGKQYIHSFYEDLVTDSSHFNELISKFQEKLIVFQSLSSCHDSLKSGHPSKSCLTNIIAKAFDFPDMIQTDRTMQQLKNAGGLRLLKAADSDSILLYDNLLRKYKIAETSGFQEVQSEVRNTLYSLLDFESWKDNVTSVGFELYGNNKELINKCFNQLKMYSLWCGVRWLDLGQIKKKNAELINYFKNKYHFQ